MCDVDGTDPFTQAALLCDEDGIVSGEFLLRFPDLQGGVVLPFHCTGHAHVGGEHLQCTNFAIHTRSITDILDMPTGGQDGSVAFWAYEECPRGLQGGRKAHSRLGLVHRMRSPDRRVACEDVAPEWFSTTHRRSVAIGDTTMDLAPLQRSLDSRG